MKKQKHVSIIALTGALAFGLMLFCSGVCQEAGGVRVSDTVAASIKGGGCSGTVNSDCSGVNCASTPGKQNAAGKRKDGADEVAGDTFHCTHSGGGIPNCSEAYTLAATCGA